MAAFFFVGAGGMALFADEWKQAPGSGSLLLYGHPRFIVNADSASGGPLFVTGSYSFTMNPALAADLQCLSADAGYTGLLKAADDITNDASFHLGVGIPTRFGVFSVAGQGIFAENVLGLGNAALGRLGWARDVTSNFYLGLSVSSGALLYDGYRDFFVAADVGAWIRVEKLAFFKQVRLSIVMQNLGKTFTEYGSEDTQREMEDLKIQIRSYPALFTPKAGVAAHLVEAKNFNLGISADIAFPTFSNILFNAGLQALIAEHVYISAGWDLDLWESVQEWGNETGGVHLPYVGIGIKFAVKTPDSQLFKKRGVDQTDITVDGTWQRREKDVHLHSLGLSASFGVRDTVPPDIKIGTIKND
jgi:hypothetical protein